jgi:cytochrome c peroxidase
VYRYPVLVLFPVVFAVSCSVSVDSGALKAFRALPSSLESKDNPATEAKVELGRMLYYDERLSKSQTVSCNSCHLLDRYGVDGTPVSVGHRGLKGSRNAPTVYNAAAHIAQFWDGRAGDVEEQAKGPILNPVEMALETDGHAAEVLKSIPEYVALFTRAFPGEKDPVTFDNAARAIGAFERGLITPARWDKYLSGDSGALSPEEKYGFKKYSAAGCHACHAGTLMGGNTYQKLGLVKEWPDDSDGGRFQVTKREGDLFVFKVPSLRNVVKTAPYFHNGKIATLDDAVREMAEHQTGRVLIESEIQAIVRFLDTLTGEIPEEYIRKPKLPPSTDRTPKPRLM